MQDTAFVIGGETIMVPPLNLKAQRVALRLFAKAAEEGGDAAPDTDAMIGGYLEVLAARLASTATPLTADEIEERLIGVEEFRGFSASMQALLAASGFQSAGEPKPAARRKPPAIPTP